MDTVHTQSCAMVLSRRFHLLGPDMFADKENSTPDKTNAADRSTFDNDSSEKKLTAAHDQYPNAPASKSSACIIL